MYVMLFNRYNDMVSLSRCEALRHLMYILRPNDGYTKADDARISELIQTWDADKRAMNAALKGTWYSEQPLPVMPPDDKEHQLCRKMAAVRIQGLMYGEGSVGHELDPIIDEIMNCRDIAYHPPSCACHQFDFWTYENATKMERLKEFYERITDGCSGGDVTPHGGADGTTR